MTAPTLRYWQAKADLCLDLAIDQGKRDDMQMESLRNFNRWLVAQQMIRTGGEE